MDANAEDFIVDSSFVLATLLPDENLAFSTEVFNNFSVGKISLTSTFLLPFEITNALGVAILRKRLQEDEAVEILDKFLNMNIPLEEVNFSGVFKLAQKEALTIYDAAYLWLARKRDIKLLSLDKHLKRYSS